MTAFFSLKGQTTSMLSGISVIVIKRYQNSAFGIKEE